MAICNWLCRQSLLIGWNKERRWKKRTWKTLKWSTQVSQWENIINCQNMIHDQTPLERIKVQEFRWFSQAYAPSLIKFNLGIGEKKEVEEENNGWLFSLNEGPSVFLIISEIHLLIRFCRDHERWLCKRLIKNFSSNAFTF